jgi:predicted lipoprotein with Yx(FWY)xxD motif
MKHKMLLFNTLLVLMLALTACGPARNDDDNGGASSTPLGGGSTSVMEETPTEEMTSEATSTTSIDTTPLATSTEMAPSTTETAIVPVTGGETLLGVSQSDTMGAYLVDKNGMTVYAYKEDTQNSSTSACTGDCLNTWQPVTMSGDLGQGTPGASTAMPGTSLTETPGTGGTGVGTAVPSATSGTGGTGLATAAPGATSGAGGTGLGTAVAGTAMPGNGLDPSLIGSITRDDGTVQLTYNGWPLYTYTQDVAPGDTNGQGKGDGDWSMVSPSGDLIQQ